jgi:hypothetical protein
MWYILWLSIDEWSKVVEIAVIAAGGMFFLVRAINGLFNINLSVCLVATRAPIVDSNRVEDYLSVQVTLDKGPNWALALHMAEVLVGPRRGGKTLPLRVDAIEVRPALPYGVEWVSASRPLIVNPGEHAEFAVHTRVAANEPCPIEVVVIGQRRLTRNMSLRGTRPILQWRGSTVSLPRAPSDAGRLVVASISE